METPVSTRSRSRLQGRKKIEQTDEGQSSTPKSGHVNITSYVEAMERKKHSYVDSDDDNDDVFPSTQAFQDVRKKGEVFWDYEASPSNRAALRRRLEESDSPVLTAPKSPVRNSPKLRIRGRKPKEPVVDKEALDMLASMEQLAKQSEESLDADESPSISKTETVIQNNDFDSEEDSFLVLCTQAMEQQEFKNPKPYQDESTNVDSNQNKKKPSIVKIPEEKKPTVIDDFDDDFDSLLSQVEMPEPSPKPQCHTILSKKNLHSEKHRWSHQSVASSSGISSISRSDSTTSFKRFNSADSIKGKSSTPRLRNSSGSIMKTWQRSSSSPEVGRKKCSKEEIDRKRLAAMKRRTERSQRS